MDKKESDDKSKVNLIDESKLQRLQTQFPLVDSQGKILLPPADLRGCSSSVYANPRQALRILKRREMKRRLALSGRLQIRRREKRKSEKEKNLETDKESPD